MTPVTPVTSLTPAPHGRRRAQAAGPRMSPRWGPVGTEVAVSVDDLLPEDVVLIGFGGIGSPHEILAQGPPEPTGVASFSVRIPDWVEAGRTYLFYMAWADQRPVAFSEPFLVTEPSGQVEVSGTLTDEGVTCPALRTEDRALFTLAGSVEGFGPGDPVRVRGTVSEMSICMQGITLAVSAISAGS